LSRWENLGQSQRKPVEFDQVPVEGDFQCQTCGIYVEAAVYIPQESLLTWRCPDGHKSFIEKFSI
jgi:hypothetical protein